MVEGFIPVDSFTGPALFPWPGWRIPRAWRTSCTRPWRETALIQHLQPLWGEACSAAPIPLSQDEVHVAMVTSWANNASRSPPVFGLRVIPIKRSAHRDADLQDQARVVQTTPG